MDSGVRCRSPQPRLYPWGSTSQIASRPRSLFRDGREVSLEGNSGGPVGRQYSHDLFEAADLTEMTPEAGVIIGDNRFDEFRLARLARAHQFDPAPLLQLIVFSRPFTCHQLHHCVVNLDATVTRGWSGLYLLGLLDTFWDEDIHYAEAARLLRDILARLNGLSENGLSVLVTLSPPPTKTNREAFIAQVLDATDAYWMPSPRALEAPAINQMSLW